MAKCAKIILLATLLTGLALTQVWAKQHQFYPVPEGTKVQWAPVPQVNGMAYAPNIAADLFSYLGQFYYLLNNSWYAGPTVNGPWQQMQAPPPAFYQVPPSYFKTPPGWARGQKRGWRGAPLPPGQMKKYGPQE